MTLGERIRSRRELLGYSRGTLCEITGISLPQLSRYEHDRSDPSSEMLVSLARGLGVTPDWLLGFSEEPPLEGLSQLEVEAVALLRTKNPERQEILVEFLRAATKL